MNAQPVLFEELETLIASREIKRRAEALRRVTDLFVSGSTVFTDEQRELFDDVMGRLLREIDISARQQLGRRMASISKAPAQVLRNLALDDEISVAAPVLAESDQLDEDVLLEGARTKSQAHLMAISRRRTIGEAVTDVLVERGNQQVALSTAANPGAKFSDFGYSALVQRFGRRRRSGGSCLVATGIATPVHAQDICRSIRDRAQSAGGRRSQQGKAVPDDAC